MKKVITAIILLVVVVVGYFVIKKTLPQTSTVPTNRLSYSGGGIMFRYPEAFGSNVWKAVTRPPVITIVPADKDPITVWCPMLKDAAAITESGAWETDDLVYSFYRGQDIGAWSLYTSLCYIFSGENKNYVIDFEIRSHSWCGNGNCWAYCGTSFEQECKDFNMEKDVQSVIETIVSTVKIIK